MEELSSYSQYLELIAAVIGIIKYNHFKHTKLKYVLFFLCYVALNEFFAGMCYPVLGIPNYIPYNIYYLVHFAFFLWWYSSLMFTRSRRNILLILLLIYTIFWLIDAIFIQNFSYEFLNNSYTLGAVLITVAACFYFIEMLNRDVVMHITSSPYFWVSFGLLVYCVTYLPFEVAITFMVKENLAIWSVVLFIINSLQYCCFAIAFIKTHKSYTEHLIHPNE
ncbi:hypothetical protein ACH3O9_18520 [Leeuwenhoekiella sp. A16]|uniref:hypothetical protein n=1 Tax=unclassified Leeuwenhoekiella TaxID=2615029 RepID=UPI003A80AB95